MALALTLFSLIAFLALAATFTSAVYTLRSVKKTSHSDLKRKLVVSAPPWRKTPV